MFLLAAFADEIDPNPDVQIEQCLKNGVRYIELRGAIGRNVLDFPRSFQEEFKRKLDDAGMGVCCIGSPIGKVKLDQPFEPHLERFRIALDMAEFFGAPFIRIFSYYPAEGSTRADLVARSRAQVLRRMQQQLGAGHEPKVYDGRGIVAGVTVTLQRIGKRGFPQVACRIRLSNALVDGRIEIAVKVAVAA